MVVQGLLQPFGVERDTGFSISVRTTGADSWTELKRRTDGPMGDTTDLVGMAWDERDDEFTCTYYVLHEVFYDPILCETTYRLDPVTGRWCEAPRD